MRNLSDTSGLPARPWRRFRAKAAVAETPPDYSALGVFRHLGRIIVGWLAIIIVIQLAVKYFGWS